MTAMEGKVAFDRDVQGDGGKMFSQHAVQRQREKPALLQAAFSHLELAMVNMEAQMPAFSAQDQSAICKAVVRLQALAGKMSTSEDATNAAAPITHFAEHVDHVSVTPSLQYPSLQESNVTNLCLDLDVATDAGEECDVPFSSMKNHHYTESEVAVEIVDWVIRLMDIFDQVDVDGSGVLEFHEWRDAMMGLGLPLGSGEDAFRYVDSNSDGVIDRTEWRHMLENVQAGDMPKFIRELNNAIEAHMSKNGRIYLEPTAVHAMACCIVRPDSPLRMSWDVFITIVLFYISIMLPYTIGFDIQSDVLTRIDQVFDFIFILDVCFNFRTAYYVHDECLCFEWRQIACHYLKTWFLLDFATCLPIDLLSERVMPDMHPAKLLKIGKIVKVFKLLRLSKLRNLIKDSEVVDMIEDQLLNTNHQAMVRLIGMLLSLCHLCHWLACFMAFCGDEWYIIGGGEKLNYSTALYWAMMTLTTVGFGDIVPLGTWERAYAIGCMAIGGFFYGIMIGKIASVISTRDLNAKAYYERMEMVQSWLFYHSELPKTLRRRIKKHYQKHLVKKAATDDSAIINDLSPALVHDVSFFLVQEEVKCNILFHNLPNSSLAYIMPLLEKVYAEPDDSIVSSGEPGVAMYIIIQGKAYFAKGHQWNVIVDRVGTERSDLHRHLAVGNSFGEEIILGLEETYRYTVAAKTSMTLLAISREGFERQFNPMPDIKLKMHRNFVTTEGGSQEAELDRKKCVRGRGSLMDGATTGIPQAFPDAVLDALEDISKRFEKTEQKFDVVHNHVVSRENSSWRRLSRRANTISRDNSEASVKVSLRKHRSASPNSSTPQPPVSESLKL